jgi:hypothetical protein
MLLYVLLCVLVLLLIFAVFFNVFGSEVKVDNTKKRTMLTTIVIVECLKNETQCITQEVYTNMTELGNASKGSMRTTNI